MHFKKVLVGMLETDLAAGATPSLPRKVLVLFLRELQMC